MIVALTGTPGTGKSTMSDLLKENDFQILEINRIAQEQRLYLAFDEKRQTHEVDLEGINKYLKELFKEEIGIYANNPIIIEGHLSHLIDIVDIVIILRCHPDILKKRLIDKGWKKNKIDENLEAEALDVITIEAYEMHGEDKVFEVDTTNYKTNDILNNIILILNGEKIRFKPGKFDWSEEILKWH